MSLLRNNMDNSINFQRASCTLDGCVKIWTSRIDSVGTETGKLLSNLANEGKSGGGDNDDDEAGSDSPDLYSVFDIWPFLAGTCSIFHPLSPFIALFRPGTHHISAAWGCRLDNQHQTPLSTQISMHTDPLYTSLGSVSDFCDQRAADEDDLGLPTKDGSKPLPHAPLAPPSTAPVCQPTLPAAPYRTTPLGHPPRENGASPRVRSRPHQKLLGSAWRTLKKRLRYAVSYSYIRVDAIQSSVPDSRRPWLRGRERAWTRMRTLEALTSHAQFPIFVFFWVTFEFADRVRAES
jgi:hypothetical protein